VYFNVNFKNSSKFNKQCICWCVNYIDFRMHGATIKKIMSNCFVECTSKVARHLCEYFQYLWSENYKY